MQTVLREEIDADYGENYVSISELKTSQHQHEIQCGLCYKPFFANKATADNIARSIEEGIDNPFVCDDCEEELEARAYDAR